jgi:hypothetical protein
MSADELNTCSAHGPTRIRTTSDAEEQSNIPLTRSILYLFEPTGESRWASCWTCLPTLSASGLEAGSNSGPDPAEVSGGASIEHLEE